MQCEQIIFVYLWWIIIIRRESLINNSTLCWLAPNTVINYLTKKIQSPELLFEPKKLKWGFLDNHCLLDQGKASDQILLIRLNRKLRASKFDTSLENVIGSD